MGLGDPFSTTLQAAQKAATYDVSGINQGIDSLSSAIEKRKQEQYRKQQEEQKKQQTMQMLQQTGIISPDQPGLKDYETAAQDYTKKTGTELNLSGDLPEEEKLKTMQTMFKTLGIPDPQPNRVKFDYEKASKMGMNYDPNSGDLVFKPSPKSDIAEYTYGLKENQRQDRLEQNAIARLSSIRGDTSVSRIEIQRDASIQTYNTINRIKEEGRMPSQIEYYDLLGQMWKARTGASPTDQAIRDLDAKTLKGNLAKAVQYFTGKPAGVTTEDILNNIQDFAKTTGEQSDELHKGYMQTHLIKPEGLEADRWENISNTGRGLSFSEATKSKKSVTDVAGITGGNNSLPSQNQAPKGAKGWSKSQGKWVF